MPPSPSDMPARTPLSDAALTAALDTLDEWELADVEEGSALEREIQFEDFRNAIAFIVHLAFEAEELGHHPEITNVYDTVTLVLRTHDAGNAVTETDLELARRIDALVAG